MSFKYEETLCPDCGGQMMSRTGQYGTFWGCRSYPQCRGTRDSQGRSKQERAEWKKQQQGENYEIDKKDEINKFSFKRTK